MIVVCDINEIWRKKPFVALAEQEEVLGVAPADWLVARRRQFPIAEGRLDVLPVTLPLSWASRTAWVGQRMLWQRIVRHCRRRQKEIKALILTSPHYLPLLRFIPRSLKTFYYGSDDYRSYEGWSAAASMEKELIDRVNHAFFVSTGLMVRVQKEYGISPIKLTVSMNATEPHFFPETGPDPVPPPGGELKRPIAGVVGGINDRMDFELLKQCAELPKLGTLLLVGPIPSQRSASLNALLNHPKCVAVGKQPHKEIHRWYQCLDVGVIPYVKTEFNRLCSPMRLFDHLASGAYVVATDACDQVKSFEGRVLVCDSAQSFFDKLCHCLDIGRPVDRVCNITWDDRATQMLDRLGEMGVV